MFLNFLQIFDLITVHLKVFNEGSTFRGKLKTVGRSYIHRFYNDELHPTSEGNQLQVEVDIMGNVADLLNGCEFHKNGKDSEVSRPQYGFSTIIFLNPIGKDQQLLPSLH